MFEADPMHTADVAQPWPGAAAEATPPPVVRPFDELSRPVLRAFFASWGAFALVLLLGFGAKLDVLFNLGVVIAFGVMYFGGPVALGRIRRLGKQPTPKVYVDTPNGRMTQTQVLLQVAMTPAILSVGMATIGWFATHPE